MRNELKMRLERFVGQGTEFDDLTHEDSGYWEFVHEVGISLAPVNDSRGIDLLVAQQMKSKVTHTGVSRYMRGINTTMRLRYQDRIFNVISVTEQDGRCDYLVWRLSEIDRAAT